MLRRLPWPLLFAAAMALVTAAGALCQAGRGEKYAFLVVCSKYNSTQLRDLPYTIEEMEDFRKVLLKTGFDADHIILLHDKAELERVPLKPQIEKQFRLLLGGLEPSDTVVVAINGHGVHYTGDETGYFCPLGADLKDKKSLVSMEFFYDLLKKSKARQKLMIVQACQNDPFVSNDMAAQRLELVEKSDKVPEGIAAIFSCMEGQRSYYDPDRKRGLFFDHVIRAWGGEYLKPGEQKLDLEEFFYQVRVKTKADALKFKGGVEQVPEIRREYKGGEWVIASAKAMAKPADEASKGTAKKAATKTPDEASKPAAKNPSEDPLIKEMKFVQVPKGTFWMGWTSDKKESKQVTIANDFQIAAYTVTQGQWEAVMGNNPSSFSRQRVFKDVSDADLKRFPVEDVSWNDVQEFLKKLNERERGKGWTYRLPKEAEWEYACRGAATSKEECSFDYYLQKPSNDLSSTQANFDGEFPGGNAAKSKFLGRPTMVGSYVPNKLGLYDMHGNVWQWCQDLYEQGASARVLRGGSWTSEGGVCRAGVRFRIEPGYRKSSNGFRLAAVPVGAQ